MKPADSTGYLQAHVIVCEPCSFLVWFQKLVAELGGCKPFAFFLLTLEHSVLEEKMFLVSRTYNAQPTIPFHKFCRPAEKIFPIVSAYLAENLISVFTYNILEAILCVGILFLTEETYHIALVRAEIDILHRTAADDFIYDLDRRTIGRCKFDCLCHKRTV